MQRASDKCGGRFTQLSILPVVGSLLLSAPKASLGQTSGLEQTKSSSAAASQPSSRSDGQGYVLQVTTREVVVEVVARDKNSQPINDLKAEDFEIAEVTGKKLADARPVSGFRLIDPSEEQTATDTHVGAVALPLGGRCEIWTTVHYELAFHPASWTSGIHTIRVTTTRKHASLSYRSQFYVGAIEVPQSPAEEGTATADAELLNAACYHGNAPTSISLRLTEAAIKGPKASHYTLNIPPDSLALAGINELSHEVRLDYGVCSFSSSGRITGSWKTSVNKPLDKSRFSTLTNTGWTEELDVNQGGRPALTRIVVREPKTGNLGRIDIANQWPEIHTEQGTPDEGERHRLAAPVTTSAEANNHVGRHFSLGSPVAALNSLCGDVYEISPDTHMLADFKLLNAVGAIYTDSLSVPESELSKGVPGSTPRHEWLGIDYYGEFWVTTPGKYEFVLTADDGAVLFIDEHPVILNDGIHPPQSATGSVKLERGRHTLHLPYFQGSKYVSLILQIKPPGGILDTFDLRDYARPSSEASN